MVKEILQCTEVKSVPNDWMVKKIKEFTDVTSGGTPSTFMPKYWNGNIRWMNSGEINLKKVYDVKGRITESGLKNSSTKLIPKYCVLIGLAGQGKTRGTVAINYVELCVNQSIGSIFPNNSFVPEYLYYNLDSRYNELRNLSTGEGGRGGLNLTIIRNIQIPLPPTIEEQSDIAQVLINTDDLIKALETIITKKKNIKQGTMQELLTGKRRLNGFENEWTTKRLGDLTNITMGQSPASKYYNKKGYGLPLIQGNADIHDRKTIVRTFTSTYPKQGNRGDTIMSVRAPVGEIAKATFDCCLGRGVCAISYINEYVYHYMIFIENKWASLSTGSTFDSINAKEVNNVELFIPKSNEEQIIIAEILSDMDSEIKELEDKRDKYIMIKIGMMQKLLTGEIRLT